MHLCALVPSVKLLAELIASLSVIRFGMEDCHELRQLGSKSPVALEEYCLVGMNVCAKVGTVMQRWIFRVVVTVVPVRVPWCRRLRSHHRHDMVASFLDH